MTRSRQRKSTKGNFTSDVMRGAVKLVKDDGYLCRQAAKSKGLSHQTLARFIKKVAERNINSIYMAQK